MTRFGKGLHIINGFHIYASRILLERVRNSSYSTSISNATRLGLLKSQKFYYQKPISNVLTTICSRLEYAFTNSGDQCISHLFNSKSPESVPGGIVSFSGGGLSILSHLPSSNSLRGCFTLSCYCRSWVSTSINSNYCKSSYAGRRGLTFSSLMSHSFLTCHSQVASFIWTEWILSTF